MTEETPSRKAVQSSFYSGTCGARNRVKTGQPRLFWKMMVLTDVVVRFLTRIIRGLVTLTSDPFGLSPQNCAVVCSSSRKYFYKLWSFCNILCLNYMCGWDRETDRWSPIYKGGWWEDCTVTSHTLIIRVQLPDVTVFAYFCLLKLLLIDTLLRRFRAFTHFRNFSAELGRCSSISLRYNTHTPV